MGDFQALEELARSGLTDLRVDLSGDIVLGGRLNSILHRGARVIARRTEVGCVSYWGDPVGAYLNFQVSAPEVAADEAALHAALLASSDQGAEVRFTMEMDDDNVVASVQESVLTCALGLTDWEQKRLVERLIEEGVDRPGTEEVRTVAQLSVMVGERNACVQAERDAEVKYAMDVRAFLLARVSPRSETKGTQIRDVTLTTQGSCDQALHGRFAALLSCGAHERALTGEEEGATELQMEMMAIIAGLKALKTNCQVKVVTASRQVAELFNEAEPDDYGRQGRSWEEKVTGDDALWLALRTLAARHTVMFIWMKRRAIIRYEEQDERNRQVARLLTAGAGNLVC